MQTRLMIGLSLALAGGLLGALLLMGGGIEEEADSLGSAWARAAAPASCAAAKLPDGTEVFPPGAHPDPACPAEGRRHPPPPSERLAAAPAADPAAAPAAAAAERAKRASRVPTYIRIRKPEPLPEPAQAALEGLRGRI